MTNNGDEEGMHKEKEQEKEDNDTGVRPQFTGRKEICQNQHGDSN